MPESSTLRFTNFGLFSRYTIYHYPIVEKELKTYRFSEFAEDLFSGFSSKFKSRNLYPKAIERKNVIKFNRGNISGTLRYLAS